MTFRIDDLMVAVLPDRMVEASDCGQCTECTKCTKCTKQTAPPTGCSDSATNECPNCVTKASGDLDILSAQLEEVLAGAGR